jgi:hypothetical protein
VSTKVVRGDKYVSDIGLAKPRASDEKLNGQTRIAAASRGSL